MIGRSQRLMVVLVTLAHVVGCSVSPDGKAARPAIREHPQAARHWSPELPAQMLSAQEVEQVLQFMGSYQRQTGWELRFICKSQSATQRFASFSVFGQMHALIIAEFDTSGLTRYRPEWESD